MNDNSKDYSAIDASCRVPLLAILGGAVVWLVVGLALAIVASLTFHMPEKFGNCAWLTYGRIQPAANDAILYGFAIPAALGVILWIFARMSETELLLPLVPIVASNLWNFGVLIGVVGIFIGDSTGFAWLEFPRPAAILLFVSFMLIAISALATFGARRNRTLQPPQWFLLASLFWFPWIYSTANLFLVAFPVRGVAQAVIDWWFTNNLLFVWLGLVGLGIAFYLMSKIPGRPVQGTYYTQFGFWTFILFAPWCGMPQEAPMPAWLPAASSVASALTLIPLIAFGAVYCKTTCGVNVECKGGPYCYAKFATMAFILSSLMWLCCNCPHFGRILDQTWFVPAQTQFQIWGFFAIAVCGAIYELLPGVMEFELPLPKFVRFQHWAFMAGVALLVVPLAWGGIVQGLNLHNPNVPFTNILQGTLLYLRISTMGLLLLLLGSLMFAANIFLMSTKWHMGLVKCITTVIKDSLAAGEVKS
jgi:cytochrome c oxidase cbb3-type subunit 1